MDPVQQTQSSTACKAVSRKATASLVFGILGIVFSLIIPIAGIILGAAGAVLSWFSRQSEKKKLSITGMVLSGVGIVIGVLNMIFGMLLYSVFT
ncbi:hypothetical protein ACFO25_09620 [Paenactinomyces guangxiensis]|uniref:DUF4190 domain-containing protein n=1 Tax=Paenactinomyces guangxiensis TaxID=1490290 RepID=UPI0018DE725E|nr:DUF4190 domain-containing protein [Paenactinomyces guangxiensis]MBH8590445.1 hypothetical protein [Paenactinomyces guangxiensis]